MSELGRFWKAASGVGLSIVLVAGLGACAPSEPATLDDVLGNWEVSRVIKGSEDFPEETTIGVTITPERVFLEAPCDTMVSTGVRRCRWPPDRAKPFIHDAVMPREAGNRLDAHSAAQRARDRRLRR